MIKLIGIKRIIIIIGLLALNLAAVGSYMLGLDPMLEETRNQLRAVDGQIAELTTKISDIKQDMSYLKENVPVYERLREQGLFASQDRFQVNRLLTEMRSKADLSGFTFTVEDIRTVPSQDAADIGHQLARSRVNIKVVLAPFDSNIYLFLQDLPDAFSGHTYLKNVNIKRIGEVDEGALKDISDGKRVGFFNANVSFDWLTLVPKPVDKVPQDAVGGTAPDGFRGR